MQTVIAPTTEKQTSFDLTSTPAALPAEAKPEHRMRGARLTGAELPYNPHEDEKISRGIEQQHQRGEETNDDQARKQKEIILLLQPRLRNAKPEPLPVQWMRNRFKDYLEKVAKVTQRRNMEEPEEIAAAIHEITALMTDFVNRCEQKIETVFDTQHLSHNATIRIREIATQMNRTVIEVLDMVLDDSQAIVEIVQNLTYARSGNYCVIEENKRRTKLKAMNRMAIFTSDTGICQLINPHNLPTIENVLDATKQELLEINKHKTLSEDQWLQMQAIAERLNMPDRDFEEYRSGLTPKGQTKLYNTSWRDRQVVTSFDQIANATGLGKEYVTKILDAVKAQLAQNLGDEKEEILQFIARESQNNECSLGTHSGTSQPCLESEWNRTQMVADHEEADSAVLV